MSKYKFTLKVEDENEYTIFEQDCFSLEAIEEELIRKAEKAISKHEDDREYQEDLARELALEDKDEEEHIL